MNTLRLAAIATTLAIAFPCGAEEPARDPWQNFHLGSWVKKRKTEEKVVEGETKTETLIDTFRLEKVGSKREVRRVESGKDGSAWAIRGKTAEEMDLKPTETRQETLTIDGKSYEATVRVYVSNEDEAMLALLTKPLADIPEKPPESEDRAAVIRLTLWEVDSLEIPFRTQGLPNGSLALTEHVVRVKFEVFFRNPRSKGFSRGLIHQAVEKLATPVAIGDQEVACVEESVEFKLLQSTPQGEVEETGTGRNWLSGEVPGHEVKSISKMDSPRRAGSRSEEVLEFYQAPAVAELNGKKLPPLEERPLAGQSAGKPLHLGSWTLRFSFYISRRGTVVSGRLGRVLAVRPDGSMVREVRVIDGDGEFSEPFLELVEPGDDAPDRLEGDGTSISEGKETIDLEVGEVATSWQAHRLPPPQGADATDKRLHLTRVWRPADSEQFPSWLPHEGAVQTLEYERTVYSDFNLPGGFGNSDFTLLKGRLSRLVKKEVVCEANHQELICAALLAYQATGTSKELRNEELQLSLYSEKVPGGELVEMRQNMEDRTLEVEMLAGWGEFEDAFPDSTKAVVPYMQASRKIMNTALFQLAPRFSNEEYRGKLIAEKEALEKRLLELFEESQRQ